MKEIHDKVQDYYGNVLTTNDDLKTSACCTAESVPNYLKPVLSEIHPEIMSKFYGCGSPIPLALKGLNVLDLGCGTGRDCYLLSALVGEDGFVTGIDMTSEQLAVAEKYQEYHREKFSYPQSNVVFKKTHIEDLKTAGIDDNSVDLVVSNCVVNLSPQKHQVLKEVFRILKPGGEFYFSDIFSDRRIPEHLKIDKEFLGECLGGAYYIEDFRRALLDLGIRDYRILSSSSLTLEDPEIRKRAEQIEFYSITVRTFKMDFEDRSEDYGQKATYLGGIEYSPEEFILDSAHVFKKDEITSVCSNTAKMLTESRFAEHFKLEGDATRHLGEFRESAPKPEKKELGGCC